MLHHAADIGHARCAAGAGSGYADTNRARRVAWGGHGRGLVMRGEIGVGYGGGWVDGVEVLMVDGVDR
jgi:hypothetical protein